jgi:hypothetical protein
MSARQNCSSFLRLVLASVLLISGLAASALGQDHASSASLTFTSQVGDTIGRGDGKTETYSTPSYAFTAALKDPFDHPGSVDTPDDLVVGISTASKAPIPNIATIVFNTPFAQAADSIANTPSIPTPFSTGTYVCTLDSTQFGVKAHVPGFEAFGTSSHCSGETGTYTINSIAMTNSIDTNTKKTVFHLTSLDVQFTTQCQGSTGSLVGRLIFHAAAVAGAAAYNPARAAAPPEFGTCPDGTTGSGTPGSGSGGGPAPTAPTIVLPDNMLNSSIAMVNSDSVTVPFSMFLPSTTTSEVTLTAATDDDSLLATITPSVIKPGGTGAATVTIRTTANTLAGEHTVTLTASDGTVSSSASIHVTVLCDPPFILGIDQPKSSTIAVGRPAQLSVKASGSGPLTYQWFTGASGLSNFPLPGGTSANFTTSALNDTTSYWVRITNPCGSVNSQTATVNVSASAKPTSRR